LFEGKITETPGLVQGVTTWMMTRHILDSVSDGRQTGDGLSLGLTVNLTDHRRSDSQSLLPPEGGFDSALLFKCDGGIDVPSSMRRSITRIYRSPSRSVSARFSRAIL
ncbi:hypothetical protein HAX54_052862, partial [Datura stramonium]|nr:hypothetical protein [Datura stramonium]